MSTISQLESCEQVQLTAGRIRRQLLNLLDVYPDGLTAYECAVLLGNWRNPNRQHTAPRLTELVEMDLVVEADHRRVNPESSKIPCTVYMLREHWDKKRADELQLNRQNIKKDHCDYTQ